MRPERAFLDKPKEFWASIRLLSQKCGYSKDNEIIAPTADEMIAAFNELGLDPKSITGDNHGISHVDELRAYFLSRASKLKEIETKLLDKDQARNLFRRVRSEYDHACPIPMNKQKGDKRAEAFLTGLVNMMIERHAHGLPCDYDPRMLTAVFSSGAPLRTMSRRVDGAFPSPVNPIAIWEIKEHYYTTTFGSRVAGGVYETLLDGMEIEELRNFCGIGVKHYLMIDGRFTWWDCGKSYLCRIFDMLHMGYVDEVLFGREVVEEMPRIVSEWVNAFHGAAQS